MPLSFNILPDSLLCWLSFWLVCFLNCWWIHVSFPINRGVLQGSLLAPTPSLLFIDYLFFFLKSTVIHSKDSTLQSLTSFKSVLPYFARSTSCFIARISVNSDLYDTSQWGRRNLAKSNTSKTDFSSASFSRILYNSPIPTDDSLIPPHNTVNTLGIHVTSILETPYYTNNQVCLQETGDPAQLLRLYKGLFFFYGVILSQQAWVKTTKTL